MNITGFKVTAVILRRIQCGADPTATDRRSNHGIANASAAVTATHPVPASPVEPASQPSAFGREYRVIPTSGQMFPGSLHKPYVQWDTADRLDLSHNLRPILINERQHHA